MWMDNPETIVAEYKNKIDKKNKIVLDEHKEDIQNTYKSIKEILESPEAKEAVAEKVKAGIEEEIEKISKKLPTERRIKADKAIAALDKFQKQIRANSYSSVPVAIIDTAITTVKLAIKAGVSIADAVELGINKVKELHKDAWEKEDDFRKDMLNGFSKEGVELKEKVSKETEKNILDIIEKKAGRLNEENRAKFLKDVVNTVESEGGLTEQRFKDLYSQALGLETMTPELSTKIIDLSKKINEADKFKKQVADIYDELIADQKGISVQDLAVKSQTAQGMANAAANATNIIPDEVEVVTESALTDQDLANQYRAEAEQFKREATRLMQEAEKLDPAIVPEPVVVDRTVSTIDVGDVPVEQVIAGVTAEIESKTTPVKVVKTANKTTKATTQNKAKAAVTAG